MIAVSLFREVGCSVRRFFKIREDQFPRDVQNLWPIWIGEYAKIKAWSDKRCFERRMALGQKYVFPVIGTHKPAQVASEDVVKCMEIAMKNTVHTHLKVLVALSQFFRWCTTKGLLNPNRRLPTDIDLIEPYLGMRLRTPISHHPAIDWREVPRFIASLTEESTVTSRALLFLILTASRLQSVVEAQWKEFDFSYSEWNVPASHMKGKQGNNRPHEVPLSVQAVRLLQAIRPVQVHGDALVFTKTGNTLSGTALRKLIRKLDEDSLRNGGNGFRDVAHDNRVAVTHGFRAAFATWAQETGEDVSVIELCLAHVDSTDKHNGAYRRGRMMQRRRLLLQRWANYCFSEVRCLRG